MTRRHSDLIVLDETGSETEEPAEMKGAGTKPTRTRTRSRSRTRPRTRTPTPAPNDCNCGLSGQIKIQRKKIKKLTKHNKALKNNLKHADHGESQPNSIVVNSDRGHLITIKFFNESLARQTSVELQNYLKELLKNEKKLTFGSHVHVTKESASFCIDNSRCSSAAVDNGSTSPSVPAYNLQFTDTLEDRKNEPEKPAAAIEKPKVTCFNCMGDHMLPACTVVLDRQRINKNRNEYYNKSGGRQSRYHVDTDPRFIKYKAGTISEPLRQALNIKKNELPPYIYRMRQLGYPPGWWHDARIESSGIVMYDSDGKAVIDEENEEGQINDGTSRVQYDPRKLVSYPGFNVYPEHGVIDEGVNLGFPPMRHEQLKSVMEMQMKPPDPTPYRRKHLGNELLAKRAKLSREEVDMDIEDAAVVISDDDNSSCLFVPPLPQEPFIQPPPPPYMDNDRSPRSPTLLDLERQKHDLMKQLRGNHNKDSSPRKNICSQGDGIHVLFPSTKWLGTSPSSDQNTTAADTVKPRSRSKLVEFGTHIVASPSPFKRLPDSSKFAKDITDHIPFENLPDSVGKYEKLKGVLDLVRQKRNSM